MEDVKLMENKSHKYNPTCTCEDCKTTAQVNRKERFTEVEQHHRLLVNDIKLK